MSDDLDQLQNATHTSPFDAIRELDENRNEYWSARKLAKLLGYSTWQKFQRVIVQAEQACEQSNQTIANHFNLTVKMVPWVQEHSEGERTTDSRVTPATSSCKTPTQPNRLWPSARPILLTRRAARNSLTNWPLSRKIRSGSSTARR